MNDKEFGFIKAFKIQIQQGGPNRSVELVTLGNYVPSL